MGLMTVTGAGGSGKICQGGAVFTKQTGDVSYSYVVEFTNEGDGNITVKSVSHDDIAKTPVTVNGGKIYMTTWPNWTFEAVAKVNCNGTVMDIGETKDFRSCYSIGDGLVWFMV